MKKILIIIGILSLMLFTGCNDYQDRYNDCINMQGYVNEKGDFIPFDYTNIPLYEKSVKLCIETLNRY